MLVARGNRQPIDEMLMMALAGGSTGDDRKKRAFGFVEYSFPFCAPIGYIAGRGQIAVRGDLEENILV